MDKESLYKTLAYFDIFSYPLTKIEAETWQWQDQKKVIPKIEKEKGFFFLPHQAANIKERLKRYKISDRKIIKAIKIVKIFRLLPSVKMIALCNSLGYHNANYGSDIDLFIVARPGTIWLTRFWLQSFLKIFRLRPFDKGKKEDGICLTFFLDSKHLDIGKLRIKEDDIYLHYWIIQLLPIYDPENIYQEFLRANAWIERKVPRFLPSMPSHDRVVKQTYWSLAFKIFSLHFWEKYLKNLQMKIMPVKIKEMANKDSRTILSDSILKFHGKEDNRLNYYKKWHARLANK